MIMIRRRKRTSSCGVLGNCFVHHTARPGQTLFYTEPHITYIDDEEHSRPGINSSPRPVSTQQKGERRGIPLPPNPDPGAVLPSGEYCKTRA